MLGLLGVAVTFSVLAAYHTPVNFVLGFTRYDNGLEIGRLPWIVVTIVMILSVTNAVNLTDGLDGLAAGSAAFGFISFVIIGFWALTHPAYDIAHSLDLAVVSAAMLGACTGFLWWNAAPARIIMGDTGSLAIGCGPGLPVVAHRHPAAAADRLRPVRVRDALGHHPGGQLQAHRPARLPDRAGAPPLRDGRAGPRPP